MQERVSYEYAVVRVVPRVDRDEFVNAGVIVFAKQRKLLVGRTCFDEARLKALWPGMDTDAVRRHLEAVEKICAGDESAGAIARMSQGERFHWLVAPRSTVIQTSPVRTGVSEEPEGVVEKLLEELVVCR